MAAKEDTRTATELRSIIRALVREKHLTRILSEITEELAQLRRRESTLRESLSEVQSSLAATPELTEVARQIMEEATTLRETRNEEFSIPNPSYVSQKDKKRLLVKIVEDYRNENPTAEAMSYAEIKRVLRDTYGIETASTGLFFRNELRGWQTRGGNKNKAVIIPPQAHRPNWK